ncbi:MAG: hypothetical protein HUJ68_12520 [Clostridia bacterium]|mgnify:CR=1 FL=1|nr:hypothetical protein [Clostridia bacterium]
MGSIFDYADDAEQYGQCCSSCFERSKNHPFNFPSGECFCSQKCLDEFLDKRVKIIIDNALLTKIKTLTFDKFMEENKDKSIEEKLEILGSSKEAVYKEERDKVLDLLNTKEPV